MRIISGWVIDLKEWSHSELGFQHSYSILAATISSIGRIEERVLDFHVI